MIEQSLCPPAVRCQQGVGGCLARQAVPGNRVAIGRYVYHRSPAGLVGLDAARSRNALEHLHHLVRGERHLVEVVAIELDRDVAADTRNQFVEAKLDRLTDLVELTELAAIGLLDAPDDVGLRSEGRREGKGGSVRVDLGGRRIIKKK